MRRTQACSSRHIHITRTNPQNNPRHTATQPLQNANQTTKQTNITTQPKHQQRILHVDYAIPPHVRLSDDCKDLLKKVLVADPAKRLTIDGIYSHPWYAKHLPPGVREMNERPQPPPEGLQSKEEIARIVTVRLI